MFSHPMMVSWMNSSVASIPSTREGHPNNRVVGLT